jgi:transposase
MERACMYDIEVKYALGLRLDERPFDHSSLGDFRQRLLENGQSKLIFDKIVDALIARGLIARAEIQRIDATHVIADIAIPTVISLVKKGIRGILIPLKGQRPDMYQLISTMIDVEQYSRERVNNADDGRLDLERRKQKLVEVVRDARLVLQGVSGISVNRELRKRAEMLQRILQENVVADGDGKGMERDYKDKPPDLLVSPVDEDARYGCKSATKRFTGYKANVTESVVNRLITNIEMSRGNQHDAKAAIQLVVEQKMHGLVPEKLIGDAGYSYGINRKVLADNGTTMVAPLPDTTLAKKGLFPKSMFHYDDRTETLSCPQGVKAKMSFEDRNNGLKIFHFSMPTCGACPVKEQCTRAKEGRRTVGISMFNKELREAEIYNATESFKEDMRLRPAIEGKLAELKRYHGLRRARYRGLSKVNLQGYFTAAAVNIKRWIRLIVEKLRFDSGLQMAF